MNYLSTDSMVVAAKIFQESYLHVMNNYDQESKKAAVVFAAEIILRYKPYMMLTPDGVAHMQDLVFKKEANRDFVLMLAFTFFSRFSEGNEPVTQLAGNLTQGVCINTMGNWDAVPKDISERLATPTEVLDILINNRWFMVLLLLQLFINIEDVKQ